VAELATIAGFGGDPDKTQQVAVTDVIRRRINGRYVVDPFGADPQLQDLVAPVFARTVPVRVTGAEELPADGPALLVTNRGLGVLEPTALSVAVRQECGRRLRIVGTIELPIVSDLLRKLGSVGAYPGDVGALLRAGHLASLPLGVTWRRTGGGVPPTELLVAALGYPVIPVRVRPGGPLGLPLTPWRVHFGAPILVGAIGDRDPLSAAELAEAVRAAVLELV
jgi:1-acyl-sn-glycerol-3-phosphate acyltransferase